MECKTTFLCKHMLKVFEIDYVHGCHCLKYRLNLKILHLHKVYHSVIFIHNDFK